MDTVDTYGMAAMLAQLTPEENCEYVVYDDETDAPIKPGSVVHGNPTIGIGRNLWQTGISQDEARFLCTNDILRVAAAFDNHIAWWRQLDAVRQRQILDMGFNMGPMELIEHWPNFLRCMQAGDWAGAVANMKNSQWWGQVGERAQQIADRIVTG